MSPRRQPSTLYQCCVSYFSHAFGNLCSQHENELNHPQILDTVDYCHNNLPFNIQVDIGEAMTYETDYLQKVLRSAQVQLVLQLRVHRLSLSGSVIQSGILENANGSHLQNLSLLYRGCRDTATKLYGFLQTATQLTHLTCTDFCDNHMLGIIARTCRNLVYLNLHACSDVTDEGILRLCGRQETMMECIDLIRIKGGLAPSSRVAPTLRELKLKMTQVTEAGVAIILLLVSNICLLRVPDIPMKQVFEFLSKIGNRNIQSKLKELRSREILDDQQLAILTTLCPNISYIQMTFTGNIDMDLSRLRKLAALKHLSAVKFADVDVDALLIFLSEVGSQMSYLQLYAYHTRFSIDRKLNITPDHIWSIGRCCPHLQSFHLKGYNVEESTMRIWQIGNISQSLIFQNLQTLKIESMKLSEGDLKNFLTNCKNIKSLDLVLKEPHVLHDRLVSSILDSGLWNNLMKIRILNAPITSKIMIRLVKDCPNLQELGCLTTWLVSKQQVSDFKEKVKSENLDIAIYL